MKLSLESTNNLKTVVRLGETEVAREYVSPRQQDVLRAVVEVLRRAGKGFGDVSAIEVNPGPGSFTGTRVGVAIANALGFALGVKVNGQRPPVSPVYDQPPNINLRDK